MLPGTGLLSLGSLGGMVLIAVGLLENVGLTRVGAASVNQLSLAGGALALYVALLGSVTFCWGLYLARNPRIIHGIVVGIVVATSGTHVRALATPHLFHAHRVFGALNQALASR